MKNFPKRRKDKNNPYTLGFNENTNSYTVTFIDSLRNIQTIDITYELYLAFNQFELNDLSFMNEYDRHIEHLEQTEAYLYQKSIKEHIDIEDEVIKKITYQELKKNIESLPDIQKRRLKMYFFDDLNLKQIAEIEGCSIRSIKYSIDIAIEKLSKNKKIQTFDFKK